MTAKIKLRRGSAADWTSQNPILSLGEPGLENDTGLIKVGDGIKSWQQLPYFLDTPATIALVDQAINDAVLEGVPGDSAYQVAVDNGFVGTEAEWLASLVGPAGPTGPMGSQGPPGVDGVDYTGPNITSSDTAPSSPSVGDIWVDTSS